MKAAVITLLGYLVYRTNAVACPFAALRESGLMGEGDAAKFDAVKRDPSSAVAFLNAHRREAKPEPAAEPAILPTGLPKLPLGGGLGWL